MAWYNALLSRLSVAVSPLLAAAFSYNFYSVQDGWSAYAKNAGCFCLIAARFFQRGYRFLLCRMAW